jgi:hypothetical protein
MNEPESTTLTDDEIVTVPLGTSRPAAMTDTGDDSGDDSGDTSDTSDTGDDSGDDSSDSDS